MKNPFFRHARRLAALLCTLLFMQLCPSPAKAATNEALHFSGVVPNYQTLTERFEFLKATYVGTYWTKNGQPSTTTSGSRYYHGVQCKGFASFVFSNLFGTGFIGSTADADYYLKESSLNGAVELARDASVTADDARAILSQAKLGDLIQVKRRYSPYNPHTMIVGGVDANGVTIFDCNSDGKCGVRWYYQSWSDFSGKNAAMSLYRSNHYPADVPPSGGSGSGGDSGGGGTANDDWLFSDLVFNLNFYRAANAYDLGGMSDDELRSHWINHGSHEGRRACAALDVKVYLGLYPDLAGAFGTNYRGAIEHFINSGVHEGRQGSADMNFDCYKANYKDLQDAFGVDNAAYYRHYNVYGYDEKRVANERLKVYFDANGGSVSPASKEITTETAYGTLPTPTRSGYKFDGWYTEPTGGTLAAASTVISKEPFTHRTLYAHWIVNECTVTFDPGTLNQVSFTSKVVQPGEPYGPLPTASSVFAGIEFAGWYLDDQLVTASTIVKRAENHTLTAGWKGTPITVTFEDSNLPASQRTKVVTPGETYGALPTPTMEGYTFTGWYRDVSGTLPVTSETKVTGQLDHSLYSRYAPNIYTITLDNGHGGSETREVAYNNKYFGLLDLWKYPYRVGYTSTGWYTDDGENVTEASLQRAYDHTLHARWTPNTYTITFDANGGSSAIAQKSVTYDAAYGALSTPVRTGYTFVGWFYGGREITSTTIVNDASDHTLVAEWQPCEYTVTFNPMQGSVSPASKLVLYSYLYGELPLPTRAGYTFAGWFTAASGGTQITEESIVSITKDTTLYARWTANSYIVTLDANGGSVTPISQTVTYSAPYGTLPTPTRTGYHFAGWALAKTNGIMVNSTTVCSLMQDHTLYAQWEPIEYAITFNANGGEGTMAALTKLHDIPQTLPACTFTRFEHTFLGWATSSTAEIPEYLPGSEFTVNARTTLYAVWKANTYTVFFDGNGGTATPETLEVAYGEDYPSLPKAERTGYDFKGWYYGNPDSADAVRVYAYDTLKENGDHTLIAKWQIKTCVIAFQPNGGTFSEEALIKTWGVPFVIPSEKPVRDGYIFLGWTLDRKNPTVDYQPGDVITTESDGVIGLYAMWEKKAMPTLTVPDQVTLISGTLSSLTDLVAWSDDELTVGDLTVTTTDTGVVRYRSGILTAYKEGNAVLTLYISDYPDVVYEISVRVVDLDLHMITLPSSLRAIAPEAFSGSPLVAVIVPQGCTSIGARAFAECTDMVYIYLPDSLTELAGTAFDGCGDALTIYCSSERIAQYAQQMGLPSKIVTSPGGW